MARRQILSSDVASRVEMARTSTIGVSGGWCPLCEGWFKEDWAGRGYVEHRQRPNRWIMGANLNDPLITGPMLAAGQLDGNFLAYYSSTGLCPFEQGQRD
jgi:hypothetical protein